MYWKDTWVFADSNEVEYKFAGNYGAKGEKRQKREKPTPEQVKKQNQRNRENRVRRLMKANFLENDYWLTLKYPRGRRPEIGEMKDHLRKFLERLRRRYRKAGQELKFIYRVEVGRKGGPHVHVLVNRIQDGDRMIKECWEHGNVNFRLLTRREVLRSWQIMW